MGVEIGGFKFINHICITFSKYHKGKKSKHMRMKFFETMVENTQFEVEVPTLNTNYSEGMIIETYNYYLTCDKVKQDIV